MELRPPPVACPLCDSERVEVFAEIEDVPTLCNALWTTPEEARGVSRGDLRLGFCRECGHIYNYAFDADKIDYSPTYENALHYSPRFETYLEALVARLVEDHGLHGKHIVEIGCGQGDFLVRLCRGGRNTGLGFDPSFRPDGQDTLATHRVSIVPDYYSEAYATLDPDLICCRHVLEHIDRPSDFVASLHRTIGGRETSVFFEVPNARFTIRDMAIWDLIYEHCSYFTVPSLHYLFTRHGFEVTRLGEAYDGQYLTLDARATTEAPSASTHAATLRTVTNEIAAFPRRQAAKTEQWRRLADALGRRKRRAVLWGGGSKGITMSNLLHLGDDVPYVVDVNPHKQGRYVTGTGQRIVPPDFLDEYEPELVIIMNAIYEREIREMLGIRGLRPEVVTA